MSQVLAYLGQRLIVIPVVLILLCEVAYFACLLVMEVTEEVDEINVKPSRDLLYYFVLLVYSLFITFLIVFEMYFLMHN